jgi:DNA-binding XRE family transcriptional regulator
MEARLVKAARAMIGMSQKELAKASFLSWTSLNAFERERTRLSPRSRHAIIASLEQMGIVFLNDPRAGFGIRLRKKPNQ